MTDGRKLGEMESEAALVAYQDHAAELREIVQGVAQLRRWSRFSVQVIIAACVCVLIAILFVESRGQPPRDSAAAAPPPPVALAASDPCTWAKEQLRFAQEEAAKLQSAKEIAEKVVVELQRENNVLKSERLVAQRDTPMTARPPEAPRAEAPRARAPASGTPTPRDALWTWPPPPAAPATEGALVVRTHTWADVWVNGQRRGTAPLRLRLPIGRYTVKLTNDLHDETVTVNVGATETVIEKSW
jgi:hypothetical protein